MSCEIWATYLHFSTCIFFFITVFRGVLPAKRFYGTAPSVVLRSEDGAGAEPFLTFFEAGLLTDAWMSWLPYLVSGAFLYELFFGIFVGCALLFY